MRAKEGDVLRFLGRKAGSAGHRVRVVEVLGPEGEPPYRVRHDDGHESEVFPGPGCTVDPSTPHTVAKPAD